MQSNSLDHFALPFGKSVRSRSGIWYRIQQPLGDGRNAIAYLVLATSGEFAGNFFAMKVFRRRSMPERAGDLDREYDFLCQCNHPGIMRVFDRGIYLDDHPFVVAEFLAETLSTAMSRGLSLTVKASFALQLVSAVKYLANLDSPVIHRDIKPDNIFVRGTQCVLGDFGLMKEEQRKSEADEETPSVGVKMPLRYRTPDAIRYEREGIPLTPQADVYQLGVTLAELFTGVNLQRSVEDEQRLAPIELVPFPQIPTSRGANIERALKLMLADSPEDRIAATELVDRWRTVFEEFARAELVLTGRVNLIANSSSAWVQ